MVITFNPLFSSKEFYTEKMHVYNHLDKIMQLTKAFFRKKTTAEKKEYNEFYLRNPATLIKVVEFDEKVRKVFGTSKPILAPITNEEYARLCNQKNRAKHMGKDV